MYLFVKKIFDILVSFLALILLIPLFISIAIAIVVTSGLPVFYLQKRVGKDWKEFRVVKFRTMIKNADKIDVNLSSSDDNRVTKIGRILRKFKLDELPQFINVFIGNMSIVGPRPEILKYAKYYQGDYSTILKVKPGISDFASLAFRNEEILLSNKADKEKFYLNVILPEKIKLYKKYLKEISFLVDIKIIFATLLAIFK